MRCAKMQNVAPCLLIPYDCARWPLAQNGRLLPYMVCSDDAPMIAESRVAAAGGRRGARALTVTRHWHRAPRRWPGA